jgi:hypothetical protein
MELMSAKDYGRRLAAFYKQHNALELDRAGRIASLEQELRCVEAANAAKRQAHKAECERCRSDEYSFCMQAFTVSPGDELFQKLQSFIRAEEADQVYADKARLCRVERCNHIDGWCVYWQNLRARRLALCGGRCEAGCGRWATDCHHLHYDTWGFEDIGDVRMLCRACHEKQPRW